MTGWRTSSDAGMTTRTSGRMIFARLDGSLWRGRWCCWRFLSRNGANHLSRTTSETFSISSTGDWLGGCSAAVSFGC